MTRPADWSPVNMGSDPTPGDADAVAALARRYHDTAQAISDQASRLKSLQSNTSGQWIGKSGDVFRKHAGDLSDRITKAHSRYQAAGDALSTFAREMVGWQNDADKALAAARTAQSTMQSNAPGPTPAPDAPPPTPAETAEEQRRSNAYSTASGDLSSAIKAAESAKSSYDSLASRVADQLHDAIQHDGVHDSWWDRVSGWVESAVKIIGIVITVLAVIALVVVTFGIALPAVLAAALTWSIFALSGVVLAADIALAATHKGSWTTVAWDAVGFVTAGFGAGAGRLARGAETVATRVAASRAGRAVFQSHNLPGALYSFATHSTTVRSGLNLFGRTSRILGEADDSAASARTAIQSLKGTASRGRQLLAGDEKLANMASLAGKTNAAVPGVVRVATRARALQAAASTSGPADVILAGHGAHDGYNYVVHEAPEASQIKHDIAETVARYDRPTVHVP